MNADETIPPPAIVVQCAKEYTASETQRRHDRLKNQVEQREYSLVYSLKHTELNGQDLMACVDWIEEDVAKEVVAAFQAKGYKAEMIHIVDLDVPMYRISVTVPAK
jgi:hypothetical protein